MKKLLTFIALACALLVSAQTNQNITLQASAAISPAAATNTLAARTKSPASKGIILTWSVSAIASGQTESIAIQAINPDGTTSQVFQTTATSATGTWVYYLYPGANMSGTMTDGTVVQSQAMQMPYLWQIVETFSDTSGSKAVTRKFFYTEVN